MFSKMYPFFTSFLQKICSFISNLLLKQSSKIAKSFSWFQFQSATFSNNVKLSRDDGVQMETLYSQLQSSKGPVDCGTRVICLPWR